MKRILLMVLMAFAINISFAQKNETAVKYMNTITAEELKDHLYTIASDEYEGRETGKIGQKKAADYIARHFFQKGLTGPVKDNFNPYFQPVPLKSTSIGSFSFTNGENKAVLFEDFFPFGNFTADHQDFELVYAGYGFDDEGYSDYKDLDVKGKGVIFYDANPLDKEGNSMVEKPLDMRLKLKIAKEKGAAFAVMLFASDEEFQQKAKIYGKYLRQTRLSVDYGDKEEKEEASFGVFFGKPSAFASLMGVEPKKWDKSTKKALANGKSPAGLYTSSVKVLAKVKEGKVASENVLGFIEGTDLKDEILVVTSHYDHVGIIDGLIHNGADDDGSGTVGVLEIVDAFTQAVKDGFKPRRSILFMTVTGEEKGLLGSEYYSNNPIFPMDKTITNLNIDMIGRIDKKHEENPNFVYIIGSDMLSSELHQISETVSKEYMPEITLDYHYNSKDDPERYYYRSDHYNFAKHNVPVIFYFNGTHEDYHMPTDTPDKIDYDRLAMRAKLVFITAWELANRDTRPVVDKAETGK